MDEDSLECEFNFSDLNSLFQLYKIELQELKRKAAEDPDTPFSNSQSEEAKVQMDEFLSTSFDEAQSRTDDFEIDYDKSFIENMANLIENVGIKDIF